MIGNGRASRSAIATMRLIYSGILADAYTHLFSASKSCFLSIVGMAVCGLATVYSLEHSQLPIESNNTKVHDGSIQCLFCGYLSVHSIETAKYPIESYVLSVTESIQPCERHCDTWRRIGGLQPTLSDPAAPSAHPNPAILAARARLIMAHRGRFMYI